MRCRVVLFDIDHTLLDAGGVGRRALERALGEVAGIFGDSHRVPFSGRTDPEIVRDLLAIDGLAPAPGLVTAVLDRYVQRLEEEVASCRDARLLPGVPEVLEALDRPGVHVGLLTGNIARGARLKLRPHGIESRFRFGAFGEDAMRRPDLLPVAIARWRALVGDGAELAPSDVYVVGDTMQDVAVARAHGARAVAVGTGEPYQSRSALLAAAPDFFFEDLRQAWPFVEEVVRGAAGTPPGA